ncbi:type 1 glutamine amidotransferase [Halorubrum lipolyticum]|uniref:Glutamine amidotransferase class-I n=1 Tax=Halorubrum lipolyticum DSM 21995 TaxID=1227482 RepID=M0NY58_9EURY|nr:type 1 glutamine amidotransferase [Halorubrum lipolyticum]EMA62488.1 glutamine amidotransferase class-I [Halorubrum lipolyticum DSM 21995]
MTRLRFALLNAAHDGANTRRNFRRELDADLVEFSASDGHLPDHTEFDGVVVTGSRSSVYWDDEWIPPLIDYVAEAAEAGLPVLGVCYGHQVVAEALGGRVAGMDGFEIGYNEVRHRGGDELFAGIDEAFTVFTTHGDAVVELPPSATLLAENDRGVHAFRDGHCWGVQFHPEYDLETAREVTEGKRERLGDARVDSVLAEITPEAYDAACEAKPLFDNFATYARRLKAERESVAAAGD